MLWAPQLSDVPSSHGSFVSQGRTAWGPPLLKFDASGRIAKHSEAVSQYIAVSHGIRMLRSGHSPQPGYMVVGKGCRVGRVHSGACKKEVLPTCCRRPSKPRQQAAGLWVDLQHFRPRQNHSTKAARKRVLVGDHIFRTCCQYVFAMLRGLQSLH